MYNFLVTSRIKWLKKEVTGSNFLVCWKFCTESGWLIERHFYFPLGANPLYVRGILCIVCHHGPAHQLLIWLERELKIVYDYIWSPLWSSGQSFWLQIQRSRVRSPALPDFLSISGSGTGSTQPLEVKLRSYLNKKVAVPGSENRD